MSDEIQPTQTLDWPPPYKEANREIFRAGSASRLTIRTLVGYVAGQPFPLLDMNDPDVATKIMWNNAFQTHVDG